MIIRPLKITLLLLVYSTFITSLYAANIYVDNTLSQNITSGSYSIANRNSSGTDGNAYMTIQEAINSMSIGDHILIRGGTYYPIAQTTSPVSINIPTSKNGTAWTEGRYNKISSYPGEWAIIDGQNNCGTRGILIGSYDYGDHDGSADVKYWIFERLEIKNARTADGSFATGIYVSGGPFKFRYLYIHDNLATSGENNPGGLSGQHWQDSVVEYCYFYNNGMSTYDGGGNAAHILIYSDYAWLHWLTAAFNLSYTDKPIFRNEIRYNYFTGGNIGFKHKASQLLSGRATGWQETYNTYGDKIHHNIFVNMRGAGIVNTQDFCQVYNNILDNCDYGIQSQYEFSVGFYKVCIYNNTIMGSTQMGISRLSGGTRTEYANEPKDHYGWDNNNILDTITDSYHWVQTRDLSVVPIYSGLTAYSVTNYCGSHNYFYRPPDSNIIRMGLVNYTKSTYESQTLTLAPRKVYQNSYSSANPLYKGSSGSSKYIPNASHVIEGLTTMSNGGIGGSHPYLAGVTIPSYIGAVDPSNSTWVDSVLGLANINYLISGGGTSSDTTPPATPMGVSATIIQ